MPLSIETMPKSKRGRPAKYDYSDYLTLNDEGFGQSFVVLQGEDYDCSTVSKQVFFSRYARDNGLNVFTKKLNVGDTVEAIVTNDNGEDEVVTHTLEVEAVGVTFVSTDIRPYTSRKRKSDDE